MIQTKILVTAASGLNFEVLPAITTNPSGMANTSVKTKSKHVMVKPSNNFCVISKKLMIII